MIGDRHRYNGKVYEETGTYRVPFDGEPFLSPIFGGVFLHNPSDLPGCGRVRHILREVPRLEAVEGRRRRCCTGRQELEETGEVRAPQKGEWFLTADGSEVGVIASRSGAPLDGGEGIDRIILRDARPTRAEFVTVMVDGRDLGSFSSWRTTPAEAAKAELELVQADLDEAEEELVEALFERDRAEDARDVYMDARRRLMADLRDERDRTNAIQAERDAALDRVEELEAGQDALMRLSLDVGVQCGKALERWGV